MAESKRPRSSAQENKRHLSRDFWRRDNGRRGVVSALIRCFSKFSSRLVS